MLKLLKTIMRAGTATVKYPFAPLEVSPAFAGNRPDAQPMYCLRCLRLCLSGKCADYQTDDQQNSRTGSSIWGVVFTADVVKKCARPEPSSLPITLN